MDELLDRMIEVAEQERDMARACINRFGDVDSLGTQVLLHAITVEALKRFKDRGGLDDPFVMPALVEAER
jgi:hypothetical protein